MSWRWGDGMNPALLTLPGSPASASLNSQLSALSWHPPPTCPWLLPSSDSAGRFSWAWLNLSVEAVPAYNANHPEGVGNGYVLTIGGRRIYFSGDTGDIPEMRALPDIDVAYVCMNVPFTMTVAQASSAVRAFRPAVVYPYHFRNQDNTRANTNLFKTQIGTDLGIEVRLRTWY